ncbi:MAG: flavodoxin family protein [Candidatus Thorarchaeota archaeon]
MGRIPMARVLGISGSPRRGGNTSILTKTALTAARDIGAKTEFIELADMILSPCNHTTKCYELGRCEQDDDLNRIVDRMQLADAIVIGSPSYYGSVTTSMKNFMDRAGQFARLEGKVGCGLVVARKSGADLTLSQIIFFMLVKEMIVPGGLSWPVGMALNVGDIRSDTEAIVMAHQMGRRVATLADILNKTPVPWRSEASSSDGTAKFGDE